MLQSAVRFCCFATLAVVFFSGCGSAAPPSPTMSNASTPQASPADSKATASAETEAAADPFWQGLERHEIQLDQTLLLVKGSRGIVACPYLNVAMFAKTGEACAIVPAKNIDGMPNSRVTAVTPKAEELGITVGMSGREALDKIR